MSDSKWLDLEEIGAVVGSLSMPGAQAALRDDVDRALGIHELCQKVGLLTRQKAKAEAVIAELLRTRAPSIRIERRPRYPGGNPEASAECVAEIDLKRTLEEAVDIGVEVRCTGTQRTPS